MGVFKMLMAGGLVERNVRRRFSIENPALRTNLFGIEFQNPVGLAAGFDKGARWFPQLACLGFSHVEVGTITGQPQPGNPKPRLFRLPTDKAIINRMGFNNAGSDAVARRLAMTCKSRTTDVLGVNIGKTKLVPVEEAARDYLFSFERLFDYADYFTINVSSPNTAGLRTLQNREPLIELLTAVAGLNHQLASDHNCGPKPVLLKIAPDLTDSQLTDIVSILREVKLDGIIATNTTLSRSNLRTSAKKVAAVGEGGLSGAPLNQRSQQVVRQLYSQLRGEIPIVGVGGIMNGEDAWQMILAGASLVQIYTGFVYGGPAVVREINLYLARKLEECGMVSIAEAVGGQP